MQQFIEFIQANMLLSLAWVGLAIAWIVAVIKQKTAPYKLLQPSEATLLVNRQQGVFVDLRSRDEFRAGHIAGAIHLSPQEIKDNNLGEFASQKANPIILVCKSGQTATASAPELAKAGFEQVYVLKDGLLSWNEAKLPLVRNKKKK